VSPARAFAEGGVPDRATLKTTSGAMVAVLRFFRVHCTLCRSPYPAAPSRLELFKRPLDAAFLERSYHPTYLNFG
jgi:hypothetical protein